jgi:proteasome lid subunit RPN8/RPN11
MPKIVLDFVERSLQSIMADAIQHFPNEAAGLLFGNIKQRNGMTLCECKCSIPLGEVEERSQTGIWLRGHTLAKVLIAEYMAIGYKVLGQFHTHPRSGVAKPSDDDLKEFKSSPFRIMTICGVTNIDTSEPIGTWTSGENLIGSIADYGFHIGAYAKADEEITSVEITTPYVRIYNFIRSLGVGLNQVSDFRPEKLADAQYSVDKLAYWLRLDNLSEKPKRAENQIFYHENVLRDLLRN